MVNSRTIEGLVDQSEKYRSHQLQNNEPEKANKLIAGAETTVAIDFLKKSYSLVVSNDFYFRTI